jgi:hypothetical protein
MFWVLCRYMELFKLGLRVTPQSCPTVFVQAKRKTSRLRFVSLSAARHARTLPRNLTIAQDIAEKASNLLWKPLPGQITEDQIDIEITWTADARTTAALKTPRR